MEQEVLRILQKVQMGRANHLKNFLKLQKLYKSVDIQVFSNYFLSILKKIIQQDHNSPYVKNMLDFMGLFVGRIVTLENDPEHSFEHPILQIIILGLSDEFNNGTDNCALNICLLFSFMLNNIGDDVVVNNYLGNIVQDVLLKSLKDPHAAVRIQGIIALTRLQNPVDEECPVINEFIKCLGDINFRVRQEVAKRLAPNRRTIKVTTTAIRDCNPKVRAAAFTHLGDIGIKYLKIIQRQHVLESGFSETHSKTKRVFLEYLLPKWLSNAEGSFLKFLEMIKLDSDEHDIERTEYLSCQLIREFVKSQPIDSLVNELPLNDRKLIPENEIESEQAVYWNTLYHFLHEIDAPEDVLESLVPELKVFADYIERIVETKYSKEMQEWELLDLHHMLYQLFAITDHMNIKEEVGRHTLDNLIKKLFRNYSLQPRLLKKLFEIDVKLNSHRMLDFVEEACSIITDIWQPLIAAPLNERQLINKRCKMAEISVKINVLEHEKEQAISAQEYLKVQTIVDAIAQKKLELDQLSAENLTGEKVKITKNDPVTLCRCLDLLIGLLMHLTEKTMSVDLINLRDQFLMPVVRNRSSEVCWRAFKALALFCVVDKDMAKENIQALTSPVTFYRTSKVNDNMLVDSIGIVTDLILLHGTEFFSREGEIDNPITRTLYVEDSKLDPLNEFTIDSFVSLLLDLLDVETDIIRETAMTALAKLIINDFPVNHSLITRLVLKWYSKATQTFLQQTIGLVLKSYAAKSVATKEVIAAAVVPILIHFAEAPRSSPLAAVKIENPITFLSALTLQERGVVHVHTELARNLLNILATEEIGAVSIFYLKMLMHLQLASNDSPAVQELIAKAEAIIAVDDECPKRQQIQNKLKMFVTKLRNEESKTTTSTLEPVAEEVSLDRNVDPPENPDPGPVQSGHKRLSDLIEDSSSDCDTNHTTSDERSDKQNNSPSKRRKMEERTVLEKPDKSKAHNNSTITTPLIQFSSSSGSDIIPPTQVVTQNTRRVSKRSSVRKPINDINANVSAGEQRLGKSLCATDSKIPNRYNGNLNGSLLVVSLTKDFKEIRSLSESRRSTRIKLRTERRNNECCDSERTSVKRKRQEEDKQSEAASGQKRKSGRKVRRELQFKGSKKPLKVTSSDTSIGSSDSQNHEQSSTRLASKHTDRSTSSTTISGSRKSLGLTPSDTSISSSDSQNQDRRSTRLASKHMEQSRSSIIQGSPFESRLVLSQSKRNVPIERMANSPNVNIDGERSEHLQQGKENVINTREPPSSRKKSQRIIQLKQLQVNITKVDKRKLS